MRKHADPNHLTKLTDGRYCKRVRGVLHYFGKDFDAAMRRWLAEKQDLMAGRPVNHAPAPSITTVRFCCNHWLTACTDRIDAGKLRGGTFADYKMAAEQFVKAVGPGRDPDSLVPADFAAIRAEWGGRMGPWALDRYVQAVRTMFNHAADQRLIGRQPFYGGQFGKSSESDKRNVARASIRQRGERSFTAEEIELSLGAAQGPIRAMILLGLNGGMYAADIGRLTIHDIDQSGPEWVVDFDRRKTGGVPWRFPLWPETQEAIKAVMLDREARRARWARRNKTFPPDAQHADLVFLTLFGHPWHRESIKRIGKRIDSSAETNAISQEFDKLLARRPGVGFGSLRHTHVTAGGDIVDERAARRAGGHRIGTIEKHYDKIPIERLRAVTDLLYSRLMPASAAGPSYCKIPSVDPKRTQSADAPPPLPSAAPTAVA
jgi:integrase